MVTSAHQPSVEGELQPGDHQGGGKLASLHVLTSSVTTYGFLAGPIIEVIPK